MLADVWTWVRLPPAPLFLCILLHSFAFLGKTLLNQRFLFLSLVFLGILLRKRESQKESQIDPKTDPIFKKAIKKDTTFVAS